MTGEPLHSRVGSLGGRTAASEAFPRTDGVRVAAVVLAAGFSSRMGRLKPLLPIGSATAIERVVASLRTAGVGQVVVVTGHQAEVLAPVLRPLGVDRAHNAAYQEGMFSSVRTGAAALGEDLDAFFVLPVDCPLVTPRVLRLAAARYLSGGGDIVYPVCLGRRGHPPLLAAGLRAPLLAAEQTTILQAVLAAHAKESIEADVRDLTVLMDMDTPEDYRALRHFADALDAAEASRREPSLTADDALFLLNAAGTPPNIVRHCRTAAAVGEALAKALEPRLLSLDVDLVRAGCLLHDIARLFPHHAALAAEVLTNLGLPRLGAVVREHMVISPDLPRSPGMTEAELVYLADKTVTDGEIIGLDERQVRTLRKMRPDAATAERIAARIEDGRLVAAKAELLLGHPIEEVLREVVVPKEARQSQLRVYLARHAQAEEPGGKRYQGQSDLPLGPPGEEQAKRLAAKLMALTGGACFDVVYSSDLQRCLSTAQIAADGCGTAVEPEPWLREIDVGLWEGLTREEAQERYPAEHRRREQDLVGTPFPQGESFADVHHRVVPRFERLLEYSLAAGHRRVLVVGHKGVNRVIIAHLQASPLSEIFSIEQGFCAVTVIDVTAGERGGWRVTGVEPR